MLKRRKTLVWAATVFAIVLVYLSLFGIQTAFALWAWHLGDKIPELSDTPRELQTATSNKTPGVQFSRFG